MVSFGKAPSHSLPAAKHLISPYDLPSVLQNPTEHCNPMCKPRFFKVGSGGIWTTSTKAMPGELILSGLDLVVQGLDLADQVPVFVLPTELWACPKYGQPRN